MFFPFQRQLVAGLALAAVTTITPLRAEESGSSVLPENERQAIDNINRLEGEDGAGLDRHLFGNSVLTGVLVDRTVSRAGKSFYRTFSQIAFGNPIIGGATLTIVERPDALRGGLLWVAEGNHVYFRTRLSPRVNEANEVARQAVDIVQKAILERRVSAAFSSNPDLGREELQP
ncbi:CsgE family curli-type amyloid fiber assembly protein [Kushneria aurantia]|uniref:Curli production assembly/transport component CsgE n=1 Tax=Kushneria aurantia TaxID=504092 RepID=A0ABV6FYZ7_9GAMM|nr:CsgE family curli-type amyloid fiber assembly protein [Kushneria aurantia]